MCPGSYSLPDGAPPPHACSVPRLKKRVALLCPPAGDLYAVLDAAKVADAVLFLLSPDGADEAGTRLLSAVFAHGVSSCAQAVLGLSEATPKVGGGEGRIGRLTAALLG